MTGKWTTAQRHEVTIRLRNGQTRTGPIVAWHVGGNVEIDHDGTRFTGKPEDRTETE